MIEKIDLSVKICCVIVKEMAKILNVTWTRNLSVHGLVVVVAAAAAAVLVVVAAVAGGGGGGGGGG